MAELIPTYLIDKNNKNISPIVSAKTVFLADGENIEDAIEAVRDESGTGDIDVSDFISIDEGNILTQGSDEKFFVPTVDLAPNRDFVENPIDLETEVTGILSIEKIDISSLSLEKGEDGKSAYEIWLEQGNIGTEQDFLDSLKGINGTGESDSGFVFIDFTLPTTSWRMSFIYENYIYEADLLLPNVTEDNSIDVQFNIPSTILANAAHILSSGLVLTGVVRLYAKKIPIDDLSGTCIIIKGGL